MIIDTDKKTISFNTGRGIAVLPFDLIHSIASSLLAGNHALMVLDPAKVKLEDNKVTVLPDGPYEHGEHCMSYSVEFIQQMYSQHQLAVAKRQAEYNEDLN